MRAISRTAMLDHYDREALAACNAAMVDADLSIARARALYFDSAVTKRLAASKFIRALSFMFREDERDVDALVVEIFDRVPYPRPAAWDEDTDNRATRRGGANPA